MAFDVKNMTGIFDLPKSAQTAGSFASDFVKSEIADEMDSIYKLESQNWFTAKPYGFKMNQRDGAAFIMFLPINPSNLTITTPFATNIIPTLYGTVEEHSDVRYFDITIEGTTGIGPKFTTPGYGDDAQTVYQQNRKPGRSTTAMAGNLSLGGFFPKTLALVNQIKNKAADLLDGGPKAQTGIVPADSGYVAFHNLYRFLMQYKKDTANGSTQRQKHPLTFFNYKDNNQYDVVVRSFTMKRDANNPMLYFYSIQLRGYNIRSITSPIDESLTQRLKDLGLNGVDSSSILGDIKSFASKAKGILGSLSGGINVLGR